MSNKILAMSLRNSKHKVITEYVDETKRLKLLSVQMSEDSLKRIIELLDK